MNDVVKIIFVDDELAALNGLQLKVKRFFPELLVLGAFQKPAQAIEAVFKEAPDILFLDIEMPNITGFELLKNLPNYEGEVIFVTAYNQYALEALKENAVDYILKPVSNNELQIAVTKALQRLEMKVKGQVNKDLANLLKQTLSKEAKLLIPTQKGVSFIPQEEVLHLEGYEGYTKIHLTNASEILSSYNLGRFEKVLNAHFFKCHKSHIVNIDHVRGFENEGYLLLNEQKRVPISKANKKIFLELFKGH